MNKKDSKLTSNQTQIRQTAKHNQNIEKTVPPTLPSRSLPATPAVP